MRGPIDDVLQPMASDHVRIVNEHRPDVNPHEEGEVEVFLDREEIGKNVVGKRLEVAIEWMERVGCERGGYNPFVVWLMNVLVDAGVVLPSVNPVNAVIGEHEEPRESDSCSDEEGDSKTRRSTRTLGSRGRTKSSRVHQRCHTTSNTPKPLPRTTEASATS